MATFTWTVTKMDSVAQMEGHSDMVVTVYWTCSGSETVDGNTYTAEISESTPIPYDPQDPWIEYADMVQGDALYWCWHHGVDQTQVEAMVQGMLDATPKPPVIVLPLPW